MLKPHRFLNPVRFGKFIFLLFLTGITACNSSNRQIATVTPTITVTPVLLVTPTPRPAPPTPTPKPSPTSAPVQATATNQLEATPLPEDMVLIAAGVFTMGQNGGKPKNGPAHMVDLPAYTIDRFEVTNNEFAHFVKATGYVSYADTNSPKNWRDAALEKDNHPVVYVTWDDAQAYCQWVKKRLPTEAEWEKAARGSDGRLYPWGNEFEGSRGNFYETGIRGTTAVGSFHAGASPYDIEDMAGNVREWVAAEFLPYPGQSPTADRSFGNLYRVNRGGGWFDGQADAIITTYNRNAGPPATSANDDIGFRCARDK